ncbi:MAG: hypothetical protein ACO1QS_14415 [Verrucomicrobiota bacterium]
MTSNHVRKLFRTSAKVTIFSAVVLLLIAVWITCSIDGGWIIGHLFILAAIFLILAARRGLTRLDINTVRMQCFAVVLQLSIPCFFVLHWSDSVILKSIVAVPLIFSIWLHLFGDRWVYRRLCLSTD